MTRKLAAQQVAEKLKILEEQIDQAVIAAGSLISALPDARGRANLSAVIGQDALDLVAQATVILSQARGKFVEAHHALAETSRLIGVPVHAGIGDKPTYPAPVMEQRSFAPVGNVA